MNLSVGDPPPNPININKTKATWPLAFDIDLQKHGIWASGIWGTNIKNKT